MPIFDDQISASTLPLYDHWCHSLTFQVSRLFHLLTLQHRQSDYFVKAEGSLLSSRLADSKIFITFLLALITLSSCGFKSTLVEPNTLRINIGAEPPGLDWHVATDSTSFDVVSNIMVGLTQYRADLSCAPCCATNWEVLDSGKRYIFHLDPKALWSDGQSVKASDFEYAWRRLLDPKTGAQYAFFLYDVQNAFEFNSGKITDARLVGVKALDEQTLEVKLKKPAAYFIYLTAFCPTFPQRKDLIEKWGDRWTQADHIVTNGPFLLDQWRHEYKIELTCNEHYFQGAPALKRIKMFMIPEQATAFALYENNELDYVDNRSFSTPDLERYRHSSEYRTTLLLRNNYIGFNVTKPPFDNVKVRQAVSMAIDRTVFPKIRGRGEIPATSWIPPGLLGYDAKSGLEYNPEKARALLAEAGYPGGNNFPHVELLYPSRNDVRLVVEAVQDQLKRNLKIHISLQNQEWKVYLETLHRDSPPIYRSSWGADFPDPETFMNVFTSHNDNNSTRWKDPHYDDLVSRASAEQNVEKRGQLYEHADRYLCREQVPIAPVFLETQNVMVKPWVKGMELNKLDIQFFRNVSIDESLLHGVHAGDKGVTH